jgi:ankyrin repeat domain-containing protein 50
MVDTKEHISRVGNQGLGHDHVASRLSYVFLTLLVDINPCFSSAVSLPNIAAGAGKTYLTSRVIDHIQDRLDTKKDTKEGFAFFYCNRNDDQRRKPLSVLQSYARQLAAPAGHPKLVQKHLRALWQDLRSSGKDLGMASCKKQILSSVSLYDKTTIILDALDECELESRIAIMDAIKLLLSQATKPLHVFVSSRPDGDIRSLLEHVPNIEIQATDNNDDIKKFVREEIIKDPKWKDMPTLLREDVEQTILTQSQGMHV